jgi:hypothetical protein
MEIESCRTCGGDGRVGNSLVGGDSSARCPTSHGTGRRAEAAPRFHDVTKTKPSHYQPATPPSGPKAPVTPEGIQLAREVSESALGADAKARLVAEIMNHESTHGRCTKTFLKKVRKQTRPAG